MKGFTPTLCGLEYGRDVVPRASPYNTIGITDNQRFLFFSQQQEINRMNLRQQRQRKKIFKPVILETILQ
jgi:hypothetical protein